MQRVYEPQDLLEAQLLIGMLASEGIEAHLTGRDLMGAIGELPVGGLLGLLVDNPQAAQARELIATYNAAQPLPDDEPQAESGTLLC